MEAEGLAPCTGSLWHPWSPRARAYRLWLLFGSGDPCTCKQAHERANSCSCSFPGPQTAPGAQEQRLLVSARLGLREGRWLCKQQCPPRDYESHHCLLPRKRRSFQPLGLQLSQQLLFIWLRQLPRIPKRAPGSPACSSAAGRDVELGHPACSPAPCVRQRRTLRPDFHLGKNYSLLFPSDWRTHLG